MLIPENIGSKYRLIVLAGERVRQLQKGATPRTENPNQKFTQIAVQELLDNKLSFHSKDNPPDEVAATDSDNQELVSA